MTQPTLATEAIRAYFTLQCCWLNNEEVYLEEGCQHCGSAATYLIYYTNAKIQKLLLDFISQHSCIQSKRVDWSDLPDFEQRYNTFLQILEKEVNSYACENQQLACSKPFESVSSIFENTAETMC